MSYNKENYRRIRTEYQTKYLRAYEEADRRMAELHQKSPALAAIDRALATTGAEIALAAIGTGADHAALLETVREKNLSLQRDRARLLAELGYPADYTLPPFACTKCNDTGFIETKMCDCMRRELILAAYETSGIGNLMRTQSFETFDLSYYAADPAAHETMSRNLQILRDYAESFSLQSKNLLFYGGTGLGKTHLSSAVARRVIERGFDVYYTTAINMFADFEYARFGSNLNGITQAEPIRYTDCELLIIDDLGAETTNQFTVSCLYNVLNNRINLGRPTIISTNLPPRSTTAVTSNRQREDTLQSRYTDRIYSRILGESMLIHFLGTDIRRQKLNKAHH